MSGKAVGTAAVDEEAVDTAAVGEAAVGEAAVDEEAVGPAAVDAGAARDDYYSFTLRLSTFASFSSGA
jgi:hypothetical protein